MVVDDVVVRIASDSRIEAHGVVGEVGLVRFQP